MNSHAVTDPAIAPPDELLGRAAADRHRPRFHFTSPAGWLNDPNGLTQRDGLYHLFYQYNPDAPVHSRIHWGHSTSTDLVTWVDQPVALVPSEGPDEDGCWSGVLVEADGVPTLVYSGRHGSEELPCLATGTDDLMTWTKSPANPVIAERPPHLDLVAFRDHCVWREEGRWRQIIGAGIRDVGGTALLYESDDLQKWSYVGELLTGDGALRRDGGNPLWDATMWECVDLFTVADAHGRLRDALVFSAWDDGTTLHTLYWTGRYVGDRFDAGELHRLDFGGRHFYAPQSMRDDAGRRIMFGWMQEARSEEAVLEAGWTGVMSLPRLVTARPDGTLHQQPAPEVAALRREVLFDGPAAALTADRVAGDQLDVTLDLQLTPGGVAHLTVAATPDGAERTVLTLARPKDPASDVTVSLDRTRSSLDPTLDMVELGGVVPAPDQDAMALRLLLDHSALEIFVNGQPLSARIYPTRPDALGVSLTTSGITGHLTIWRMADALPVKRPHLATDPQGRGS